MSTFKTVWKEVEAKAPHSYTAMVAAALVFILIEIRETSKKLADMTNNH